MNTSPIRIDLTDAEQKELGARTRSRTMAHRDVVRARIILLLAEGHSVSSVARQVGKQRMVVRKWAERFLKKRLEGLRDKPGRGRMPAFSPGDCGVSGQARVRAA